MLKVYTQHFYVSINGKDWEQLWPYAEGMEDDSKMEVGTTITEFTFAEAVEALKKDDYPGLKLGYTFFRKFYIFFDYQNAMIEMYSSTPQIQPIPSFYANIFNINFIKYIIYLFISSSMFITICYNIIIKLTI